MSDSGSAVAEASPEQEISSAEVKSRAVKGASTMMVRGLSIRAVGLIGNIFLARLLSPDDFGVAALGVTIIVFSAALSDGGLATLFVRGKTPPTREELRAAISVQLYISAFIVTLCCAGAAILETKEALVVATMSAPILLVGFRVPGFVHFGRTLQFGPTVRVEISETLASVIVSIVVAFAGGGVWAFVAGQWARVIIGTAMMVRLGPDGLVLPRWNTAIVRRLIKYGLQFQGIAVAGLGLAQGLNIAVAAAGGVAALGVWSLISRLLQIPVLVFQGLRRVSYPGVARLLANGDDLGPVLLRVSKLASVLGAIMVVPVLGASDPGVVLLFGDQWVDAQDVLPWAVAVVFINGPMSVAAFSYATVTDKLSTALSSSAIQAIGGPLLVILLYPSFGLSSLIIATGTIALLDACVLGTVLYRGLGANVAPTVLLFSAMVVGAGLGGKEVATSISNDGLATLAGAISAEIFLFALIFVFQRSVGIDALRLARRAVKRGEKTKTGAAARPAPAEAAPAVAVADTEAESAGAVAEREAALATAQASFASAIGQTTPGNANAATDLEYVPFPDNSHQPSDADTVHGIPTHAYAHPAPTIVSPGFSSAAVPPAAPARGVPAAGVPAAGVSAAGVPAAPGTPQESAGAPVGGPGAVDPAPGSAAASSNAQWSQNAPAVPDGASVGQGASAGQSAPTGPSAPAVPDGASVGQSAPAVPTPVDGPTAQAAAVARLQEAKAAKGKRPKMSKADKAAADAISLLSGRPVSPDELPVRPVRPPSAPRGRWNAKRNPPRQ